MNVERFSGATYKSDDGQWVRFSDVAALLAERGRADRLAAVLASLRPPQEERGCPCCGGLAAAVDAALAAEQEGA